MLTTEERIKKNDMLAALQYAFSSSAIERLQRQIQDPATSPDTAQALITKFKYETDNRLSFGINDAPAIMRSDDIVQENPKFAWEGAIPTKRMTMFPAPGGLGKSTIGWYLASLASRGELQKLGRTEFMKPENVLVFCGEDEWGSVVKPTLIANGADLTRVYLVSKTTDGKRFTFENKDVWLRACETVEPRFIIVDNISKFTSVQTDSFRSDHVYREIALMDDMADKYDASVLTLHHTAKPKPGAKVDITQPNVYGSVAYINAVRSVLQMKAGAANPKTDRVIAQSKRNGPVQLQPTLFRTTLVPVEGWYYPYFKVEYVGLYDEVDEAEDAEANNPVAKAVSKQQAYNDFAMDFITEQMDMADMNEVHVDDLKAAINEADQFSNISYAEKQTMFARFRSKNTNLEYERETGMLRFK